MPDIETYLDTIANGVYGEDVRAAIIGALRQCYADGQAGSIDLQARADIATIKNQIGTTDISSLGSTLSAAVIAANANQYYDLSSNKDNYVQIGIHDWLNGMFTSGQVSFYVPLDRRLPKTIPSETAVNSATQKPYIIAEFAKAHPNDTQFRTVGANGWKTTAISGLSLHSAVVTYNRSGLWVILNCPTTLQPLNDTCFVSGDMTFTFTDGT